MDNKELANEYRIAVLRAEHLLKQLLEQGCDIVHVCDDGVRIIKLMGCGISSIEITRVVKETL